MTTQAQTELAGVTSTGIVGDVDITNFTELAEHIAQRPLIQVVPFKKNQNIILLNYNSLKYEKKYVKLSILIENISSLGMV